jgi:hypothetical protein
VTLLCLFERTHPTARNRMRSLFCPKCKQRIFFEQLRCPHCSLTLAFDPAALLVRPLNDVNACSNRNLIGCNWSADEEGHYCCSCALTRTIPNLGSTKNQLLWSRVEQAKRRLIYDLRRLRLPLSTEGGVRLSFDILSEDEGEGPILTGHSAGLITLNLAEADDVERESRRVAFREPYRTLLGNFRHEVGHFYWDILVSGTTLKRPSMLIFGDESRSYEDALKDYHTRSDRSYDRTAFISEYASSHPWEDWAETFAHFLHIVSTLDSVAGLPLSLGSRVLDTLRDPYLETDFGALLAPWTSLSYSLNELNRSLGLGDAYPFELSSTVLGKLHLVHMAIHNHLNRAKAKPRIPAAALGRPG